MKMNITIAAPIRTIEMITGSATQPIERPLSSEIPLLFANTVVFCKDYLVSFFEKGIRETLSLSKERVSLKNFKRSDYYIKNLAGFVNDLFRGGKSEQFKRSRGCLRFGSVGSEVYFAFELTHKLNWHFD